MGSIVDRHYLTPLFNPGSIVVFAGDPDAEPPTPLARTLRRALREGGYAGRLYLARRGDHRHAGRPGQFARRPGADRAAARADAGGAGDRRPHPLPRRAGAVQRHAAGAVRRTAPDRAPPRRAACWGPTAWACSARRSSSTPARWGRWRPPGPLALVSQSGALTASILDWARQQRRGLLHRGLAGPQHRGGAAAGAGLPGHRRADAEHPGLHGRHPQRAALHERAARGGLRQAGGGDEGRPPAGGPQRGAHALGRHRRRRRRLRRRAAPRRRGAGARSSRSCSRPRSAWPRASARWASGWPSSPTAAGPACWRPTGPACWA